MKKTATMMMKNNHMMMQ